MTETGLDVWKIEKRELDTYRLDIDSIYGKQGVRTHFSGLFVYAGGLKCR